MSLQKILFHAFESIKNRVNTEAVRQIATNLYKKISEDRTNEITEAIAAIEIPSGGGIEIANEYSGATIGSSIDIQPSTESIWNNKLLVIDHGGGINIEFKDEQGTGPISDNAYFEIACLPFLNVLINFEAEGGGNIVINGRATGGAFAGYEVDPSIGATEKGCIIRVLRIETNNWLVDTGRANVNEL